MKFDGLFLMINVNIDLFLKVLIIFAHELNSVAFMVIFGSEKANLSNI
jgi:hypothetical protein